MFDRDTVFVDIETTGGNVNRDRITEIAIITMRKGELVSEWSTLVNPLTYIPDYIESLTGINDDMVRDEPSFAEIHKDIHERLSNCVFVAHNARFDYGFLKNEFKRCSITFRAPVLCTVKLSRNLFPEHKRHNLDSVMQRHGLTCSARHRAMGDARVLFDFMHTLYSTLIPGEVDEVIHKLLKRPSLPAGISEDDIDPLPESTGVYLFYDKKGAPLYIGKSVNIRSRVMSHFSGDHRTSKDMKICQTIASIDYKQTAGELGALILESSLIKKYLPIYNHRLRRYDSLTTINWNPDSDNSIPKIITADTLDPKSISNHFGLFKTKKRAKDTLRALAKEHQLCEKQIGLESGKGACFAYQLKNCKGTCVGKESYMQHKIRMLDALQPLKNKVWPFDGRIGIKEVSFNNKWTDIHIFENWCYLGTVYDEDQLKQLRLFSNEELMFDLDTYKILIRYLKNNSGSEIINI
ncbi:MAG: GIY-YIG nuclease family protein [Gammaproteobacteria bacterium]|nr:GIY-YIG nuclease family protein [Gammaproteobacteria bacterium]